MEKVRVEVYVYSLQKKKNKKKTNLKKKSNDDIYRHTQAERFHYQQIHTAREVKESFKKKGTHIRWNS